MTNYSSFNSNLILILIECNPSTNYMTQTQNNPHFSLAIMYKLVNAECKELFSL